MGLSPAWQAGAAGFAWLGPHLRSRWPKYIGASCEVDPCGQLARILHTVASSVPIWTTFLQSLPQMRRRPCSSHCLRRRSPPVFRRCALWIERHLHLSVGPLPEQKEQRIQAKALIDSRLRVIVSITPHKRACGHRRATPGWSANQKLLIVSWIASVDVPSRLAGPTKPVLVCLPT